MTTLGINEDKPTKSPKCKKDQSEEYINILQQKCEKLIPFIKKTQKIGQTLKISYFLIISRHEKVLIFTF